MQIKHSTQAASMRTTEITTCLLACVPNAFVHAVPGGPAELGVVSELQGDMHQAGQGVGSRIFAAQRLPL